MNIRQVMQEMKVTIPIFIFIIPSMLLLGIGYYYSDKLGMENIGLLLMLPFFYIAIVLLILGLIGVRNFQPISKELILIILGLCFALFILLIDYFYLKENPDKLQDFLSNILVEANGMMLDIIFVAFLFWAFQRFIPTKKD